MKKQAFVSVSMITYNHEKYVAQAIESVLAQQTNFPIELVIGEDCSTDATRTICEAYAARYPDIIRLLPLTENQGFQRNFIRTLSACEGKYIALLDGDDFWDEPQKLNKQAQFLEENALFNMVFHNVHVLKNDKMDGLVYPEDRKSVISISDILSHDYTQTCSILFRAAPFREIPPEDAEKWIYNDVTLFSLILSKGTLGRYMPDVMATYRIHEGGVWSMVDIRKKYFMSRKAEDILINCYYSSHELRRLITKRERFYYHFFSKELVKHHEFYLGCSTLLRYFQWAALDILARLRTGRLTTFPAP
jgi:glycosyltransferase involved in cell wall biosynthesis